MIVRHRLAALLCLTWALPLASGPLTLRADEPSDAAADPQGPAEALEDELSRGGEGEFPGQEFLDEATRLKVAARQLQDLARVIELCTKALELGVDEQNAEFAGQLIIAARLERASRLAREIFDRATPSPNWPRLARVALVDLEQVVADNPDIAEAQLLIGRLQALPGGNRDQARKAVERAIAKAGEDVGLKADALALLGELTADDEKKLGYLNQALQLVPDNVQALRSRGLYYMARNEHEKAVADFRRAVELEPEHAKTHEVLAIDLLLTGKLDEAKAQLDKAVELAPQEASAYAHRARIYLVQGQLEEALADINRAIELNKDNLGWRLLRAQIHQEAEDIAAALADVERIVAVKADFVPAIRMRAVLLAASDREDEAIAVLERALKQTPDNLELLFTLAAFQASLRQPREAVAALDRILQLDPDNFDAYRRRADTLLSIGQQAAALQDYERALKIEPKDSGVLNNLAWVLATSPEEKLRNGRRALELAQTACEVTEYKKAYILSTLAAAHAELGDFDTAVKWSQKALDLGEADVRQQLAQELESYQAQRPWRERQNVEEEGEEDEETSDAQEEGSAEDVTAETSAAEDQIAPQDAVPAKSP
ncbi:MAG: tetratricopeptide repeat protein [Planctomycetales bacterium]|nr:tetratricopeptide repeat protein [Planctomycetales bacterium]